MTVIDKFKISGKIVIITGGAGLLGQKHAEAVMEGEGIPILLDISEEALERAKDSLQKKYQGMEIGVYKADITDHDMLMEISDKIVKKYGHIDVLINNAANNPKVEDKGDNFGNIRFDNFPLEVWNADIMVGLTGAFLCAQVFGTVMAEQCSGVILNISSDLGIIAPDQRIYRKEGVDEKDQTIKPVTYSVIKHGLLGLTKYLATYWANQNIRVNAVCPGGIFNGQDEEFLGKLTNLIPMGRMADKDEYKATVLYLISEASSYMTGATVIVDGGRTCW
ncbi:MAG: SDR family oxidoreductase [Bacteroidales bacterium]|nr:SDR family oxidoreductase [Bacteroidales bacterium]MCM1414530.1 SDR family oxidoreductase [bacterium]MCM1422580.1 SDR family oxidoreductase [bacterium]